MLSDLPSRIPVIYIHMELQNGNDVYVKGKGYAKNPNFASEIK